MQTERVDTSRLQRSEDVPLSRAARHALGSSVSRALSLVAPYRLSITPLDDGVLLRGDAFAVDLISGAASKLSELEKAGRSIDATVAIQTLEEHVHHELRYGLAFRLSGIPHPVRPLTVAQAAFLHACLHDPHPLVFGIGPTGTGKTHLALAAGLGLLAEGAFQHLVLTRPQVLWQGEIMTAPRRAQLNDEGQLTPIEDELNSLIGYQATRRLVSEGKLEIAPIGSLRGRTFNQSFIVVDEAQNLLIPQMRMVLTRLGRESKMVLIGDPEQVDLRGDELSGLPHVLELISGRDLARVHRFAQGEIIRNPLVAELEALYAPA